MTRTVVLLEIFVLSVCQAAHFFGGSMSWRVKTFNETIELKQSYSWLYTAEPCRAATGVANSLTCLAGCATDVNVSGLWSRTSICSVESTRRRSPRCRRSSRFRRNNGKRFEFRCSIPTAISSDADGRRGTPRSANTNPISSSNNCSLSILANTIFSTLIVARLGCWTQRIDRFLTITSPSGLFS